MVQVNPKPAGATEAKIPAVKAKAATAAERNKIPVADTSSMPQGALPTLGLFVAHCIGCNRDTLFARVIDKGVLRWFCSHCGHYMLPG